MKILIINSDYTEFLSELYASHPGLKNSSYEEQIKIRNKSLFGLANYYSSNFQKLGHEARDIFANNETMQHQWEDQYLITDSTENSRKYDNFTVRNYKNFMNFLIYNKYLSISVFKTLEKNIWFYPILKNQILFYQPDVVLNQDMHINPQFFQKIKSDIPILIGQHAGPSLPEKYDWKCYNFVISAYPPTIEWFQNKNVPAYLNRLGFEPSILSQIRNGNTEFDISFVGSLQNIHSNRKKLLEDIVEKIPQLKIWTPDREQIEHSLLLKKCNMGPAWGKKMYAILKKSKITLNIHGNGIINAANMRLYEATGMGTLLITDWKKDISDIFEPDKEIITYKTPEECIEKIQYYLEHDKDRETIARAGQERTLKEHTYFQRVKDLINIIQKYR